MILTMKKNNFDYNGHDSFVAKVRDLESLAHIRYTPVMTSFLSPVEWTHISDFLSKDTFLYLDGGYEHAQRKVACISSREIEPEFDFDCLRSSYNSKYYNLKHPDILGALMHIGIDRDFLGDFVIEDDFIYIFCKKSLSEFIINTCISIGRCPVSFSVCTNYEIHSVNFEEVFINCASLRLDSIIAQLAHCSRSEATKKIKQGFIKVNDVVLEQNVQLCNNDFVSIRRVGRFQFKDVQSITRKQRLVLQFIKFK